MVVLHFASVPPPIYAGRPAAIPAAAASNDAANEPSFLAAYREAAACQLPPPRQLATAGAAGAPHLGELVWSLELEMALHVAVGTPEIEEGPYPRMSSSPDAQSPSERARSLRLSTAGRRESLDGGGCAHTL